MTVPSRALRDGTSIPIIGFGTIPLHGSDCYDATRLALRSGYRLFDAASNYHNEVEIGQAVREFLKETGTSRGEIVIQVKVPARLHQFQQAMLSCSDSQQMLGLGRLDVAIVHAPEPGSRAHLGAWGALIELQNRGIVRTIGVSNCTAEQLVDLIDESGVTPAIHQVELNAYHAEEDMCALNTRLGIVTQAWNPLGGGASAYVDPPWAGIAVAHRVTPDQVVMRWHLQLGNVPLPMKNNEPKQRACLDVFGFELSAEEMAAISSNSLPTPSPPGGGENANAGWGGTAASKPGW
ncbi:MAG: aldo/keto reductase [Demequinaceae bacterium]|nr:aldo/keto reductase [Demequinaceae bacterium]